MPLPSINATTSIDLPSFLSYFYTATSGRLLVDKVGLRAFCDIALQLVNSLNVLSTCGKRTWLVFLEVYIHTKSLFAISLISHWYTSPTMVEITHYETHGLFLSHCMSTGN